MPLRRNILLFHQGALGDFILTWPLALGLARVFAQSRVFYVTGSQKGALAEKAIKTESVDVEGGWHQLFSSEPRLPEAATRLLAGAHQVISFVSGPDDLWARNVRAIAPEAGLVTMATVPPEGFAGHVTDHLAGQLKAFPVIEAAMDQMLRSVRSRGLGLTRAGDGAVVLHPGAGSVKKCWPAERYLGLAARLVEQGRKVRVILGDVEREKWPAGRIEEFERVAEVCSAGTLTELMNRILGAAAFVGNDSGPGHLAAMLGIPTVSIFGPNDPTRWRPIGPRVTVVTGPWEDIDTGRIINALSSSGHPGDEPLTRS